VAVDGVDLRQIDPAQWRERMSAGFQDFVKFEFQAGQAVGIGDLTRSRTPERSAMRSCAAMPR